MDVVAMEKRRPIRWIPGRRREEAVGDHVVLFDKTNREWPNYVSRSLKRTLSGSFWKHWTTTNR